MLGKGGLLGADPAQNAARDAFAELPAKDRLKRAVTPLGGGAFAPTGGLASASKSFTGSVPGHTGGGPTRRPVPL